MPSERQLDTVARIGTLGWALVFAVALAFLVEDVYLFLTRGAAFGVEFLAAGLVVVVVLFFGLRQMGIHRPP